MQITSVSQVTFNISFLFIFLCFLFFIFSYFVFFNENISVVFILSESLCEKPSLTSIKPDL